MHLARLGFCVSYDELIKYKQSVVMAEQMSVPCESCSEGTFTQWVADNVDHNTQTLDGHGTFHGMGLIAVTSSNCSKIEIPDTPVPRLKYRLRAADIIAKKRIDIVQYQHST
jgi:hypothetical protein